MKSIASLEVDFAVGLLERLKQESILLEVRTVTQDSGLEYSDIMVADIDYNRACDVAEAWQAEQLAEAERKTNQFCPRCGSPHLEYISADTFGIGSIWKCKDCGNDFAR